MLIPMVFAEQWYPYNTCVGGDRIIWHQAFICEDCFKQYNCKEDNTTSKEPKNARRIINAKDTDNLFCRKCGAKLLPDSVFCSKCGTKIK